MNENEGLRGLQYDGGVGLEPRSNNRSYKRNQSGLIQLDTFFDEYDRVEDIQDDHEQNSFFFRIERDALHHILSYLDVPSLVRLDSAMLIVSSEQHIGCQS